MALAPTWKLIIVYVVLLANWVSQSTTRKLPDISSMVEKHDYWMTQYRRTYKDDLEKARRFEIFKDNVKYIESFNEAGTRPYKLAINKFADLTEEELWSSRNGYKLGSYRKPSVVSSLFRYANVSNDDVPSSMDWRENGAVTDVKSQGSCGCCWAFAAVAAVEGIYQITTGHLLSLSEQELVDCDKNDPQDGCKGGRPEYAYDFITENGGLTTESNYPYQGVDGICNFDKEIPRVVNIAGYEQVPANSESSLLKAVANQPVSVGIDDRGLAYHFYSSGVFKGECGTELQHAVTIVGYGVSSEGIKYWLIKNSWGENWGEGGYMRMERDVDVHEGLCGIAMEATYPIA